MIGFVRYVNLFLVVLIIPKLVNLIRFLSQEENDKNKINLVRFGLLLLFFGILLYTVNSAIIIVSMIIDFEIKGFLIDINSLITNVVLFVSISMFDRIKSRK